MVAAAQNADSKIETSNQEDIKQLRLEIDRLKQIVSQTTSSLRTAEYNIAQLEAHIQRVYTKERTPAEKVPVPKAVQEPPKASTPTPVTEQQQHQQQQPEKEDDIWPKDAFLDRRPKGNRDPETEVLVRNVPYHDSETEESLENLIHLIAAHDNLTVDVHHCFRLKRRAKQDNTAPPIIVSFTTRAGKATFRTKHEQRLTVAAIQSGLHVDLKYESSTPIYIDENLTRAQNKLYYVARKFKKKHNYRFCWPKNGHVFLRKTPSTRIVKITNVRMLEVSDENLDRIRKRRAQATKIAQPERDSKVSEIAEKYTLTQ